MPPLSPIVPLLCPYYAPINPLLCPYYPPSGGAPPAPGLVDRRVEITGPVDRKMVINALNSGATQFMADFEGQHFNLCVMQYCREV
jgi:hypothetical protein